MKTLRNPSVFRQTGWVFPCLLLGATFFFLPQGFCQIPEEEGEKASLAWLASGENRILELLQQAVDEKNPKRGAGARRFLSGRTIQSFTVQDVVQWVLERNLTLAMQPHQLNLARQDILAAEASFKPALNVSVQYNRSKSYNRSAMIGRLWEIPKTWEEVTSEDVGKEYLVEAYSLSEENILGIVEEKRVVQKEDVKKTWFELGASSPDPCIIMDGQPIEDTCVSDPEFKESREFASGESADWSQYWSGTLGLSNLLSWGGTLGANLKTTYIPYEVTQSRGLKPLGAPLDTALALGDEEWSSNLSLSFNTPLPSTKNFGAHGFGAAVQEEKAWLGHDKSVFAQKTQINQTLRDAIGVYWSLVRSTLMVLSSLEHLDVLAKQLAHVERMYKDHLATEYDRKQAKADLENARDQEEIAWNHWIVRANELAEILDLPLEQVVVPRDYWNELVADFVPDDKAALEVAMTERPEIRVAQIAMDEAALERAYRAQALLPDLTLTLSYNAFGKGSGAIFGYDSFWDSLRSLSSPDERNYFIGLVYTYPWDNQVAKARHVRANASYTQAQDRSRAVAVRVGREVATSLATAHSSQSRTRLAQAELQLAKEALQSAKRQEKLKSITEFELLRRHQDLFDARIRLVETLIDRRQSWVNLQAAEGKLAAGRLGRAVETKP